MNVLFIFNSKIIGKRIQFETYLCIIDTACVHLKQTMKLWKLTTR